MRFDGIVAGAVGTRPEKNGEEKGKIELVGRTSSCASVKSICIIM